MRILLSILSLCLLCACNNEKVIQLPEITHSEINEILLDVSPAYLFYDESKPDSLELNRKNLIGSTNWLVNVDKRLTLDQAIPSIIFLQEKKRNKKMHKNEAAKNYFTCNNTSINNLGFIEFTDIVYHIDESAETYMHSEASNNIYINFLPGLINLDKSLVDVNNYTVTKIEPQPKEIQLILNFDKALSFQEYITIKSKLKTIENPIITINTNEFIY